jgi:cytochrome P450
MTAREALPARTMARCTGGSVFGVAREFSRDPLAALSAVFAEHGDLVKVRFFGRQYFYFMTNPDYIRHVFATNADNYTKAPHPAFVLLSHVMGNGLVTSDGALWGRQRRLVQPAFTKQRVADYGDIMTSATKRMTERWDERVSDDAPLNVDAEMMRLTLEIVGECLFSIDIAGEAGRVGSAFTTVSDQFAKLLGHPLGPMLVKFPRLPSVRRFNDSIATLDDVVEGIIADRRASGAEMGDLLSLLMAARDAETGAGMDDRQLRDEVMTLLLSGHETTADALTWTLYLLDKHPEILTQLENEVEDVLQGRTPGVNDLGQLSYTKMVVQEALRLYPPIFLFARWGQQPDTIGGCRTPADANIMVCPWVLHRHPGLWEDPERFDPTRFTPERVAAQQPYSYIPFGGGPRQCLGVHFALMEAQLLLATIVQRYRLATIPGHVAQPGPMMTLRPQGGMPMLAVARERATYTATTPTATETGV